jgi:hypothetical protein
MLVLQNSVRVRHARRLVRLIAHWTTSSFLDHMASHVRDRRDANHGALYKIVGLPALCPNDRPCLSVCFLDMRCVSVKMFDAQC